MGKQQNFQRSNWILRAVVFLGASIFNSLPLNLRNIDSRVLFRKALDDYYSQFLVITIVVLMVSNFDMYPILYILNNFLSISF